MQLPKNHYSDFTSLIADIDKGQIKIPQFQRDFVWTTRQSAALMDSIIKGYPIGTFIFWKTKERLRAIRNLGGHKLPEPEQGEFVDYVLDGQQRLTSIYACLKGISIERTDNKTDDFSKIYIKLKSTESEQIVVTEVIDEEEKSYISILDLLTGEFDVLASYPKSYHSKLKRYKQSIENYQYPIIQVKDAPIHIATEIFTRINVGGKSLSLFEIMVAKTFDYKLDFDLSEKYKQLIDELRPMNYETISDATVLQTVAMIMTNECKRKVILQLDKYKFIHTWDGAIDAIRNAVDYLRGFYRIPVSQLLPYNALIVPFAYFFYHHKDKPTGTKQKYLQDFFWRCSLAGRYSSSVESKLAQDIKRVDAILDEKLPSYDWPVDTSADFIIDNGWFSAGRSYIKAMLCIFAYFQPKSFNDNSIVNINNYWLKQANSKNYHHFFPVAYLRSRGTEGHYVNHILNITIVDDFLNKRVIRAKSPAEYMKKFNKENPDIEKSMSSHLIGDLTQFGIWDNNYEKFYNNRAKLISKEIEKRIIKQDVDNESQIDIHDDYEEDTTVAE